MIAPNVEPLFSRYVGFFGAPRIDKGTQGNFIDEKSGISQMSAGETLCVRTEIKQIFTDDAIGVSLKIREWKV